MVGQRGCELGESRLLQGGNELQCFAFGVGISQWQLLLMQQAAQQCAIQQAEGLARFGRPESLDLAGDIGRQAVGLHRQAEEYFGRGLGFA